MKVLVPVHGTHGDVLPFLAVGRELARRGHEVVVHAPAPFSGHAARAGLPFAPLGTQAEFEAMRDRPEFRRLVGGLRLWAELGQRVAGDTLAWIADAIRPGDTVVVAPPQSYGARIAQERFGLPTATLHLCPFLIESAIAAPRLPGLPVPAALPGLRHRLSRGADAYVLDRFALPPLNAVRAGYGLAPVRRLRHWWNSPNRMILAFPDWYAAPQLDWPLQAVQTGFPLADRLGDAAAIPPDLAAFLDAGEAPLAFAYSSWSRQADGFLALAARVCARMGRRGVLLGPRTDGASVGGSGTIAHAPYAPLSLLLPRCAALVHHGGVGSVAQALAAGVPQVVVPFMGDHYDEGERIARIGAGRVLGRRSLTPGRLARALAGLLDDPATARACAAARARIAREDGVGRACDAIEALPADVRAAG